MDLFCDAGPPRIAPLALDVYPDDLSSISLKRLSNGGLAVTYDNVKEYGQDNRQTFQVLLTSDGTIDIYYAQVDSANVAVGLSGGYAVSSPEPVVFSESICGQTPHPTSEMTTPAPTGMPTVFDDNEAGSHTQEFPSYQPLDLVGRTVVYSPVDDPDGQHYSICVFDGGTWVPTDAPGTAELDLGDDDSIPVSLEGMMGFTFFGVPYSECFVGSNGYITFREGDSSFSASILVHFQLPRISALFCDLSRDENSTVTWLSNGYVTVVTWEEVRVFGTEERQSMQVTMYRDGTISVMYAKAEAISSDRIVGLSDGFWPDEFVSEDLDSQQCLGILTPEPTSEWTPVRTYDTDGDDDFVNTPNPSDDENIPLPTEPLVGQPPVEELAAYRPLDLIGHTVVYTPEANGSYSSCVYSGGDWLPALSPGSYELDLADDSSAQVSLAGLNFTFFGARYDTAFIGSNGYVTFGSEDSSYSGTVDSHFSLPRISALFCDLTPDEQSTISWQLKPHMAVVTWEEIKAWDTELRQSMQATLHRDGTITVMYTKAQANSPRVVGLSEGIQPDDFVLDDLDSQQCISSSPIPTPAATPDGPDNTKQPPTEELWTYMPLDLIGHTVVYRPLLNTDNTYSYSACVYNGGNWIPSSLPGTVLLPLGDDDSLEVSLSGLGGFAFFGTNYSSVFVGSNGYITFGMANTYFSGTITDHFALPRISALFCDLSPDATSSVSWLLADDRLVVTWEEIRSYGDVDQRQSFQASLFSDGTINVMYAKAQATSPRVVGLSNGVYPESFVSDDLDSQECVDVTPIPPIHYTPGPTLDPGTLKPTPTPMPTSTTTSTPAPTPSPPPPAPLQVFHREEPFGLANRRV
eukprot:scaffold238814_cov36-Prasinocladus_malaysianus.AAC.1